MSITRHLNEIEHGKYLAAGNAEEIWGWGTPAGRLRARRRAAYILEGAQAGPSDKIVEVGCGTGMFTEMFAQCGAEITAFDISPDLLLIARKRQLPRVQFIEKSFEDCTLDGSLDAVIGSSVLHHLELQATLRKIFSLLKPGGRMSFAEPNMLNPQVYCERHFRQFYPSISPDETAFVRYSLKRELEAFGFSKVVIRPFDWLHPATPQSVIPFVSGVGRMLERIPLVSEFAGSLHIRATRPE